MNLLDGGAGGAGGTGGDPSATASSSSAAVTSGVGGAGGQGGAGGGPPCQDLPCVCANGLVGMQCTANDPCTNCQCAAGLADCDAATPGCETNILQDKQNCGACDTGCADYAPGTYCDQGVCSCTNGLAYCHQYYTGCFDLSSDPLACGSCNNACMGNQICVGGICVCPPGLTFCNFGCFDLANNEGTCGGCNYDCSDHDLGQKCQWDCVAGDCVGTPACASAGPTHKLCGGDCSAGYCTDTATDPNNCGDCDVVCPVGGPHTTRSCSAGQCALPCDPGYSDCDGDLVGTGCEVHTVDDVNHCGSCGTVCSAANGASPYCLSGWCRLTCDPGWGNCQILGANDGCETFTDADPSHCGACSTKCPGAALGNSVCAAGTCVCPPGHGDCNGSFALDGCETATVTDSFHCGACGHSCQGGPCNNGACLPFGIALGQVGPDALAVDGTHAYWANAGTGAADGGIARAPKFFGGATSLLVSGRVGPIGLLRVGNDVVWTERGHLGAFDGGVYRVPATGGVVTTLAQGAGAPLGLVTDGTLLYWTANEAHQVLTLPLVGGAPTVLATVTSPRRVALDGTHLYVTQGDGALARIPLAGGAAEILATGLADPWGLAVDGTTVYVRLAAGGALVAVPKAGGAPATLASGLDAKEDVALDGNQLVYGSGGALYALPIAGGPPQALATADASAVLADPAAWFWTDSASGTVKGLAR